MLPHTFPISETLNDNILINSDELNTLSEWDNTMIQTYQNQIKDGALRIQSNQDLKNMEFIRFLKITELQLYDCKNIIPKLENSAIKKLSVQECEIYSLKDFRFENLEDLYITNYSKRKQNLLQEIRHFQQLKCVIAYCTPLKDLSQLSQMTGLIVLYLNDCDLRSTEAIRPLINLTELYLWNNKGVDITSLQFLTNLKILELRKCNLVSIDALRPLTKLESLDIAENSIVYVQPLTEHKQLSELNARYNQILDGNVIEQHHNFYKFQFTDQKKPTKKERSAANILRSINSPIVSLKAMQKYARSVKSQNNTFRLKVSESLQIQFNNFSQFVARASSLLQQMNQAVNEWQ
ncbi:Conserved_hypothetical protein [Hexamita inflata]|uniref:Uncharacterized protein n=1 Tax=Hexamita inflata TaxID=28002 RepID=A0AA86RY36_9EUKA|nr:Conserved hypothetical protein [Hexamita inflata]